MGLARLLARPLSLGGCGARLVIVTLCSIRYSLLHQRVRFVDMRCVLCAPLESIARPVNAQKDLVS